MISTMIPNWRPGDGSRILPRFMFQVHE